MPMALTLIEAIAGRPKAEEIARGLGLQSWDARHASDTFRFNRPFAITAMQNLGAFWNWEKFGIELAAGVDEVSLALVADSWSRTYRSRAVTFAPTKNPVTTQSGLRVVPDVVAANWPIETLVSRFDRRRPAIALDDTLRAIGRRYGSETENFVATQLEYPQAAQFANHMNRTSAAPDELSLLYR